MPRADENGSSSRVVAVIVNYNSDGLLKQAVDALERSVVRPVTYVVDNASTDDSLALAREGRQGDDPRFITNSENVGFAAANNSVLNRVEADYFLLLNPDCTIEPDTVGTFISCLDADAAIGIAGGTLLNTDGSVQKTSKRRFPTPWSGLARTLGLHRLGSSTEGLLADFDLATGSTDGDEVETVEAISGAMMFVRASALDRVGLLDEGYFMHCEDLDWCKRFLDSGYRVVYVPRARAVHAKGGSGRGARVVWHLHRGMIRFYRKHYSQRYPVFFNAMVYTAVYARCFVLMLARALVPGNGARS